ncbi:MAG: hypothetical protein A3B37_01115 [Candidatus Sungbacteria bacterium RIFCSPLOWO2_01_FULL_59_16]|uniref:DoxX family protein n=1 Tax=Candidatus Sungbacteria bacterium RIFCSPLOWO2_01_FULL_59_16 TaxID=1802280 RepID=A0A1G2LBW3_9BACT|nr:MAG: hypothetical protein A3B37_01115 [Candidatus Sungbacteria bacterium RIFCSPLOWO2_01_FULL_59_16]
MFDYLFLYQDWAPTALRLALGVPFVLHGYPKLFKNFAGAAAWFDSAGIRPGWFWVLVVGVVEFFGGIALVAGAFTRLAAALIAIDMLVAMAKVKWGKVRMVEMEKTGWELDLAYFAMAAALVLLGPGAYALESVIRGLGV